MKYNFVALLNSLVSIGVVLPNLVSGILKQYVWQLKVVPATFLLVCFVCLKEKTCETRKNVFYFTLKAPFILEIIKF